MITSITPTCVNGKDLLEWLTSAMVGKVPEGSLISIIPNPTNRDANGESCFFVDIDIDETITLTELSRRTVTEHSRGSYIHFYVEDVVAAACGAGELNGVWFWLYFTW